VDAVLQAIPPQIKKKMTNTTSPKLQRGRFDKRPRKELSSLKMTAAAFSLVLLAVFGFDLTSILLIGSNNSPQSFSIIPSTKATSVYHNFSGGNLTLAVTPATVDQITRNDNWTSVASVEGYCGSGLTNTHGVDPRTVLGTEYANNALPGASPCVNANKGNPSAYNGSGVTEFDTGDYLAIGFQGNVQNNPYLVFFLNTTGQTYVRMSYDVIDIDGGNNDAVTQMALQYRVGETGNFVNIPSGYVADATDGNRTSGRVTKVFVTLPAAALNQPKVQVRVLTTFGADKNGAQTPNEWVGVNNFVISNLPPTAGAVSVGGRVMTGYKRPISNALVTMYDSTGNTRTVMTNPFGFYRFDKIQIGSSYIFTVFSKRYVFTEPTQFHQINGEEQYLDFIAEP
jgi:hypothetical protein